MAGTRPAIPRELARAVKVEAGHRCAIPTCRATSGLQIHHIRQWSKTREHTFENLILLCSNCHSRITSGEIDTTAVVAYKANLGLLASRYGDLERRVLNHFLEVPSAELMVIDVSHAVLLQYLVADGLLVYAGAAEGAVAFGEVPPADDELSVQHLGPAVWRLTPEGREVVERLRHAEQVE